MDQNKSEIVAILDKSGSMSGLEDDTIGGYNSFLKEQREVDGEANITLVLFDHEYEKIYDAEDIDDVDKLDSDTYKTRGSTALLDAVGRTINDVGNRLDNMEEDEKPANVIFFILTDGAENSSKEFSADKVADMIEHQENKYSWEFIYGGANVDAFAEAGALNIKASNTFNYSADSDGIDKAYRSVSKMSTTYRTGGGASDFEDAENAEELTKNNS